MSENEAGGSAAAIEGNENEEVWAISDILNGEEKVMEEVAAVLGDTDDINCSYDNGYMKRQPLYACLTCIVEAKEDFTKSAGVCLACSYHCHDGHNLIELYTKRKFRCDCGNKRFPNGCNLQPSKTDFNEDNSYNQNFSGLYCTCSTIYPNPEDPIEDEMAQCILCEDWYHYRHLGASVPVNYAEMICERCIEKHDFLLHYDGLTITKVEKTDESETADISVESQDAVKLEDNGKYLDEVELKTEGGCCKPKTKSTVISTKFMENEDWRNKLCKCPTCMDMYKEEQVEFLLDEEDTVQFYEEKGKVKMQQMKDLAVDTEQKMLNSMDRVNLIELLAGYNDFKEQLGEYLKKFAENKKVIREEDIKEFFSKLKSRKKQKTEMPYYCR